MAYYGPGVQQGFNIGDFGFKYLSDQLNTDKKKQEDPGLWDRFTGTLGDLGNKAGDWLTSEDGMRTLGSLGLSYLAGDKFEPVTPTYGYQGSIKDYEMVRERVPGTNRTAPSRSDLLRGARARRFFSDSKYVENPDEASDRVKKAAQVAGEEIFTDDVLGDVKYREELAGTKQYSEAEQAANPDGAGYGYTDDGRIIYVPDERKAYREQITAIPGENPILGDVIPEEVDDGEGTMIPNPLARDPITGREILDQAKFDALTGSELLTDDFRLGEQLNLGTNFSDDGYIIEQFGTKNPDLKYDEQGRLLDSEAEYYTNLEAARLDAKNQAAGLAGLVYDPTTDGYRARIEGDDPATTPRFNPTNQYGQIFADTPPPVEATAQMQGARAAGDTADRAGGIGGFSGIGGGPPGSTPINVGMMAKGGLASFAMGSEVEARKRKPVDMYSGFLRGDTKGQDDAVPASIEGSQPAALSDGEFVLTADVVAHLGDGNTEAGARILDDFMRDVRKEATGSEDQAEQIDGEGMLNKLKHRGTMHPTKRKRRYAQGGLATLNQGGAVKGFFEGGPTGAPTGTQVGTDTGVNTFFGDHIADALGRGRAAADAGFQAYEGYGATYDDEGNLDQPGILTAGSSELQDLAFTSAGDIDTRGFGELTQEELTGTASGEVDAYGNPIMTGGLMNPYTQAALEPQLRAERERAAIQQRDNAARMAQAGSFGGSRQAILDAMGQRDSAQTLADIRARGYEKAFDDARAQFGEDRQFGLDAIQKQADLGKVQSDILQANIDADRQQFEDERDFQQQVPQYLMDLLQGMPVGTTSNQFSQASEYGRLLQGAGGINTLLGGGNQTAVPAGYTLGYDDQNNPILVRENPS